jgi:ribonuclease-3
MTIILDYTFKNDKLIKHALRHSSAKAENLPSNERLEFLGDAVLGLVISDILYEKFPEKEEGELTSIKSEVVSRPILKDIAFKHGINSLIEKGKGIKQMPDSILANTLEAILGAVYLDSGLSAASKIIKNIFSAKIDEISQRPYEINYKAMLQHISQKENNLLPEYRLAKTNGPAHDPIFEVTVKIGDKTFGPANGKTKKEAEQSVAKIALESLKA